MVACLTQESPAMLRGGRLDLRLRPQLWHRPCPLESLGVYVPLLPKPCSSDATAQNLQSGHQSHEFFGHRFALFRQPANSRQIKLHKKRGLWPPFSNCAALLARRSHLEGQLASNPRKQPTKHSPKQPQINHLANVVRSGLITVCNCVLIVGNGLCM
jgi:hypothetical protein